MGNEASRGRYAKMGTIVLDYDEFCPPAGLKEHFVPTSCVDGGDELGRRNMQSENSEILFNEPPVNTHNNSNSNNSNNDKSNSNSNSNDKDCTTTTTTTTTNS